MDKPDTDSGKVLISIITAITPIVFSYIFKRVERRSAIFISKSKIEEADRRMDFVQKYLDLQSKIVSDAELSDLKKQASAELAAIKQNVDLLFIRTQTAHHNNVSLVQRLFLTFRPATGLGWVLAVLFYILLCITSFALFGSFLDVNGNFSMSTLKANVKDGSLITGVIILLLACILIRFLAIRNYKKHQPPHA